MINCFNVKKNSNFLILSIWCSWKKINQSEPSHGFFKNCDINQSEPSLTYRRTFKLLIPTSQSRALLIWRFSIVLISTNQNQAAFIEEILSVLMSINQKQAFLIIDFSKVLISTNQNRTLLILCFLLVLISTNDNQALFIKKVLRFFDVNETETSFSYHGFL